MGIIRKRQPLEEEVMPEERHHQELQADAEHSNEVDNLQEQIEKLNEENLALDDKVKEQHRDLCDAGGIIQQMTEEREILKAKLIAKERAKSKKICPFMSQTVVTACRPDCVAYWEYKLHSGQLRPMCSMIAQGAE